MTKSRTLRKAAAVALSLAMAFSVATVSTDASAAAKPSLKKTKVTVKAKKSVKVGIKNYKLVTKLTVKSKNTKIAKVAKVSKTKGVKITGVKKGKTKVVVTMKYKVGKKVKTLKKNITVNVAKASTDDDGTTVTESLKIIDTDGLQTDGTAIASDVLRVQVPASIGTIARINWYVDDAIAFTSGAGGDFSDFQPSAYGYKKGVVVARVVTTKDTTYQSNSITVSDKEVRATISGFAIEDDYTDNFVDVAKLDKKAVVSVTLNKAYEGNIKLYKYADSKLGDANGTALETSAYKYPATIGESLHALYTSDFAEEYKVPKSETTLHAEYTLGHYAAKIINDDGSVTFKWFYNTGNGEKDGLARGTSYVALFDQAKVIDDDAKSATPNISNECVAPYVTAPSKLVIEPVSNKMQVKADFVGEDGKALSWLGFNNSSKAKITASPNEGLSVANSGFDSFDIYVAKDNSVSNKSSKFEDAKTTNNIVSGVYTTTNTSERDTKGAWFIAEAKTTAGIFGKESAPLASEAKSMNPDVAKVTSIAELGTKTTAEAQTAKITLENVAGDSTLYVITPDYNKDSNDKIVKVNGSYIKKAAADKVKDFDPAKSTTYAKAVEITKGQSTVNVEGVYSKVGDKISVVVVPKDADYYGKVVKDQDDAITATFTKFGLSKGSAAYVLSDSQDVVVLSGTGTTLAHWTDTTPVFTRNDQFGDAMNGAVSSVIVKKDTTENYGALNGAQDIDLRISAAGVVTLYTLAGAQVAALDTSTIKIGQTWTGTLDNGQKVIFTVKKAASDLVVKKNETDVVPVELKKDAVYLEITLA